MRLVESIQLPSPLYNHINIYQASLVTPRANEGRRCASNYVKAIHLRQLAIHLRCWFMIHRIDSRLKDNSINKSGVMIEWNKFNSDCQITLVSYEPLGVSNHWQPTWTLMNFHQILIGSVKIVVMGAKTKTQQTGSVHQSLTLCVLGHMNMYFYYKALLQIKVAKAADIQVIEWKRSACLTKSLS